MKTHVYKKYETIEMFNVIDYSIGKHVCKNIKKCSMSKIEMITITSCINIALFKP